MSEDLDLLLDELKQRMKCVDDVISCYETFIKYRYFLKKVSIKNLPEDNNYIRNVIYRDDMFELIQIVWSGNAVTKMHDHAKNGCLMMVTRGSLDEKRVSNTGIDEYNHINIYSDPSYMHNRFGMHVIQNTSNLSVSYHLYSPPCYQK